MTLGSLFAYHQRMRSGDLILMGKKLCSACAGVVIAFAATSLQPIVSQHEASADTRVNRDEITIGTELMATDDVQLSRAGILKGSKVSVTKLLHRQGEVASVDVILADGHVVKKVAMGTIRAFFRIVSDR